MRIGRFLPLLLILTFFHYNTANAQFGSPLTVFKNDLPTQKECAEITGRKLVVMKVRWDIDQIDEYTRKKQFSQLEEYKDNCAAFSNSFTEPVSERWTMHDTMEYHTFKELREMYQAGETNVIVVALARIKITKGADDKKQFDLSYSYYGDEDAKDSSGFDPNDFKALVVFPIEQIMELPDAFKKIYVGVQLEHQNPSKEELYYAVDVVTDLVKRKAADNTFTDKVIKQSAPKLKDYTLAISKDDWDEDYKIKDAEPYYPLPIEVMEPAKFKQLITEGKPGYAYAIKVGLNTTIMLSDKREVAYLQQPNDIPTRKASDKFANRDFHKIYEAVTGVKVEFKE